MNTNHPNPASAKEKAEGSRENVAPSAKAATDRTRSQRQPGDKNTEQTLKHPGRNDEPKVE